MGSSWGRVCLGDGSIIRRIVSMLLRLDAILVGISVTLLLLIISPYISIVIRLPLPLTCRYTRHGGRRGRSRTA